MLVGWLVAGLFHAMSGYATIDDFGALASKLSVSNLIERMTDMVTHPDFTQTATNMFWDAVKSGVLFGSYSLLCCFLSALAARRCVMDPSVLTDL